MRAVSARPSEVPAGRLAPLAVLPVFLELTGRSVVIAGGDAAAAWKAELAAAAGADVRVFAPAPSDELAALLTRGVTAGSLHLVRRTWAPADFVGAALAIASTDDDQEAAAFHAAARAAGAPVNVVDRAAFSTVQFGSIVNRSPVVVGISTGGAAPILAQAIRQRIEMLLPPSLAAWAARARALRTDVKRRLPDRARRRAFWVRFAEAAFGRGTEPSIDDADAAAAGRVTLVGAGPGDAGLLTLNAVRAMQAADVILFDDLVSDDVLALARREARKLLVGKRGGRVSCRQEDINALMVRFARSGRRVVRLKSGDPMIFGRANEEIAELRAAGIAVDVVPGITTALALAASLGTSLTERQVASSVRFVTGHAWHGKVPADLDWQGLADTSVTTVYYMAGRTFPEIAARLRAAGMAPGTPVVIARAVGRPDQRIWHGTIAAAQRVPDLAAADQPVVIGVGRVFATAARRDRIAPPGDSDVAPTTPLVAAAH